MVTNLLAGTAHPVWMPTKADGAFYSPRPREPRTRWGHDAAGNAERRGSEDSRRVPRREPEAEPTGGDASGTADQRVRRRHTYTLAARPDVNFPPSHGARDELDGQGSPGPLTPTP